MLFTDTKSKMGVSAQFTDTKTVSALPAKDGKRAVRPPAPVMHGVDGQEALGGVAG